MFDRHFDVSATAQLVVDAVGDAVVCANQQCCQLLERSQKQVLAMPVSALFGKSFPELIIFTQELLDKGQGWTDRLSIEIHAEPVRQEISGRCVRAGDQHHLYLSLQPADALRALRDRSDASRHHSHGLGHWNRVARVFQEFERENQLLLDAAGEGIYGVDTEGLTTFVNPAAQEILGYTAAELAGKNMHSTVHHSHADGSNFNARRCPIFAAFRDGEVHSVEDDVFWSKDGRPIDVEYTSTPIKENGQIVGAVVVFRDVSQKKADRRRLLEVLEEVQALKHRLELENAYLQEELNSEFNHHQLIGSSHAIQNTFHQIQMVAPTDSTVLIHGESGTGKELIARAIHEMSDRAGRSLIRVNCAAVPEDLFESEFFGHAKGAFTGAIQDRIGRFELADGGTLFLDEVGEIPLHQQGKLLRVLQEQQFERVGEAKTRQVDVRIISATNRNLRQLVADGLFREDLYFRLNVFPIESEPLRRRKQDIPQLALHFLRRTEQRANKAGLQISNAGMEALQGYDWPGNIRELENVIERQVILAKGDLLHFRELQEVLPEEGGSSASGQEVLPARLMAQQERENMIKALTCCGGKVSGQDGAAMLLGLKPTTLASRLKKQGIDPRRFKGGSMGLPA
ncbi:sigma-54 interaction domain-containing protein [Marinobacterium mangrovicola]|uniref:PAS domain S-box-containing protein n=1 Tax=Marinobacterium mangrovicola TaxID=1476959 RepID=A0A4R1G702_9GAMM|nr:sigma 54-interacting transcriptional regulator [Marinobacterium mangrovicola]TCK02290.1 PAS domain S-box-containing protein [Marinobacterium mangrovicola]